MFRFLYHLILEINEHWNRLPTRNPRSPSAQPITAPAEATPPHDIRTRTAQVRCCPPLHQADRPPLLSSGVTPKPLTTNAQTLGRRQFSHCILHEFSAV
ncbi:hypothetical protein BDQ17DRAFT_1361803 [Cyathus striatus]|nr:hypothetical protein BDQ17DRAFT_1361803 [Cyathus striatus]